MLIKKYICINEPKVISAITQSSRMVTQGNREDWVFAQCHKTQERLFAKVDNQSKMPTSEECAGWGNNEKT